MEFDVLIAGARVGGSILAALLGDAGFRVLLVDKESFPSPAISTHFFRGHGMVAVLRQLGIYDQVMATEAPRLTKVYTYRDGRPEPQVSDSSTGGEAGHNLSIRRVTLDHLLVQRASATSGVEFRDRTRLTELLWDSGRVAGAKLVGPQGEYTVRSRFVIGADGKRSAVAKAVQATVEESEEGHRAIYYWYVQGFTGPLGPLDGAEFSQIGDEMAYVFPSDHGVTCIAVSVNLEAFAQMKKDPVLAFDERMRAHRGLYDRWAASTPMERILGVGPERNYVRVPVGPGWALVGDAGLYQDPWSGNGMDCASAHASYLAEALQAALSGQTPEPDALAEYHRRRNEHGLKRYHETVTLSRDLRQLLA